ncbi:hypothetical protein PENARI_c008G07865 [Penicillium arizonense]|uniref:Uncharacterized protein n=1 Tax=Penicillium arizonense TaxID=1835702 RepID=A0A1F5LJJ4_PENAI|nr:hypothetical protein PENARI_c008G07865 [Penicillium arizonense]OGE53266.1 hypothetical protein PENARI_c008G07865 [Penicillium arizonense]
MASKAPCRDFARGDCRWKHCKYSHVKPRQVTPLLPKDPDPGRKHAGSMTLLEREVRVWKGSIPPDTTTPRPSSETKSAIIQKARKLINTNTTSRQEVVQTLATEHGLKLILDLVLDDFQDMSVKTKEIIFTAQILPLLQTVSHPGVLSSLVLEQPVGTIYNVLFGIDGSRAARLLNFTCDVLANLPKDHDSVLILQTSLLTFSRILDLNSSALIQECLHAEAKRFEDLFIAMDTDDLTDTLQQSRKHLEHILQRMEIGRLLPTGVAENQADPTPDLAFVTQHGTPGGRHDNDHADICNIRIMPSLEEISSRDTEYLPVINPFQWHVAGLDGLLDRNFRLLREDTVGQLRDAIHHELDQTHLIDPQRKQLRKFVYHHLRVIDLGFNWISGFYFEVEFPQPTGLDNQTPLAREMWWQTSKRLHPGALVCVLVQQPQQEDFVLFCTVANRIMSSRKRKENGAPLFKTDPTSLWKDPKSASVTLMLVDSRHSNLQIILDLNSPKRPAMSLVEFPGVLLAAFAPALKALQAMKRDKFLPFSELFVPWVIDEARVPGIRPPPYALAPGFAFNLRCIMKNDADFYVHHDRPVDFEYLQENSSLDGAQSRALVNCLGRQLGLIQGPPGTGKSFTGVALVKVLLANRGSNTGTGPILCVTYTNHALDQLLEALLDNKVTTQIVRIGAQSKSERLEKFNLQLIAREGTKTKVERRERWRASEQLSACEDDFRSLRSRTSPPTNRLKQYLQVHHRRHHNELFGIEEDGFRRKVKPTSEVVIDSWIQSAAKDDIRSRSVKELQDVKIFEMSRKERQRLYDHWNKGVRRQFNTEAIRLVTAHKDAKLQFDCVQDQMHLRCLANADVIGATTAGLARRLDMFRKLHCKFMICEEAGEVLESHLLTAFLPTVEHAILIGDQQQLRPQVQNYELSSENPQGGGRYALDISLFERLVSSNPGPMNCGLPFSTLETQRRMHPSIARLIRQTLYPQLKDSPSVQGYPVVTGMRRRLFWWDHRKEEGEPSSDAMSTSHWNGHEIEMTVALLNHLVQQGKYENGDIAVLTPYLGQLHRLRQSLRESFALVVGDRDDDDLKKAGYTNDEMTDKTVVKATLLQTLRVATVDNFQGEEAKVVVISLVRSNPHGRCGFLRSPNRINVLLSRAQHGMYIIGNSQTALHVPMWAKVIEILRQGKNIGTALDLECPRHPSSLIKVSTPDDFPKSSPEGGCHLRCVQRLACGHACIQKCHSELLHNAVLNVVTGTVRRALIPATLRAMVTPYVPHAKLLAMGNAATRNADANAMSLALLAQSRNVFRNVLTARVQCLVQLPVIMYHALSAAKRSFPVVINAQGDGIKDHGVDFILGLAYKDTNLDENPCIFPKCDHFLTIESMDAQMDMGKHYELDASNKPVAIRASSTPFSIEDIRTCATCRGPLRDIARYGRLIRRAILDESTKKLILLLNQQYVPLAKELPLLIDAVLNMPSDKLSSWPHSITISGTRNEQVKVMQETIKSTNGDRWNGILDLRMRIGKYRSRVEPEEQPFERVRVMVEDAQRRKKTTGSLPFLSGVLQTKGYIQATALLLRLDIALFADFSNLIFQKGVNEVRLQVDLQKTKTDCKILTRVAFEHNRVMQQVEGLLYLAQLCGLERAHVPSLDKEVHRNKYLLEGLNFINEARKLCMKYPGQTRGLADEVDCAETMLRGTAFWAIITSKERMEVISAMAQEFQGTGHWYYCRNGHPFTIGECGGAVETTFCPDCGAPVGGENHQTAAGVTLAEDLEQRLTELGI